MILKTRHGAAEVRVANVLGELLGRGRGYADGQVRVTAATVGGLPAVDAALTGASTALACLNLGVWRGRRTERREVTSTWQSRLFAAARPNPEQTWFEFWEAAERSMTARRNGYVWRTVADGRVAALWALHPDQVSVSWSTSRRRVVFDVQVGGPWIDPTGETPRPRGRTVTVDDQVVLHVKGPGGGGALIAPSPIQVFRATLGAGVAQQGYQEAFYTRGVGDGLVLSFPMDLTADQAADAKRMWEAGNSGLRHAHGTRVVSGGATVTQVGLSQKDAQFVESAQLGVDDAARIFVWPASLIGGSTGKGAPMSPEHELTRMVRYCLLPRMMRWEAAIHADPLLFGEGARDYPEFDREGLIRADVATQTAADVQNVQSGILLVDEVRAERGLQPLPDGLGQIPQIVPVGGSPAGVPLQGAADTEPEPEE